MSAEFKSQNGTLRVLICGEIDHHTARELCESIDLRIASAARICSCSIPATVSCSICPV